MILRVRAGQNYGFPSCDWDIPSACAGFAKPLQLFAPDSDPFGLVIAGSRLYINEYGGHANAKIVWMPLTGGRLHTVAVDFNGYTVGFGEHDGRALRRPDDRTRSTASPRSRERRQAAGDCAATTAPSLPSPAPRSTSTRTVVNVGSAAPCRRAPAAVSARR